jgi:hypothetical protein
MVYCEHCGRTDGCGYQDFHGATICFRCYRAARDREYEERRKGGVANVEEKRPSEAPAPRSQIQRLIDQFLKKG